MKKSSNTIRTCLSIDCPERKSICCRAYSEAMDDEGNFGCAKCKKEFVGGECATGKKVDEWWEEKFKGPMGVRNKLGRFVKGGKPIAGFKKGNKPHNWEYFEKEVTKHTLLLVMNVLADKWDAIENQDPDQSEEKWRSYKGIRNNIRDTIKQIAKTKGIKI